MRRLTEEQNGASVIHKDYMPCVSLSSGEGRFLTSKHIGLRYHSFKEQVDSESIVLEYVSTNEHLCDILTKTLASVKFNDLMKLIAVERFV